MRLEGKVALITGGGTGIGAAIAKRFVEEGAKVCITGRRIEMLDKVAQSLPAEKVATCSGDVSMYEDVVEMVTATLNLEGRIDVLVNNAGIDPGGTVTDLDEALWRTVLEVNVTGPFLTMKATIPHMMAGGGGSIINISSLGGVRCLPGTVAYGTSKAALNHLTKQTALDYGPHNIRCNAVCPGATRTKMLEEALAPLTEIIKTDVDGVFDCISSNVPLKRVAAPEEISGICAFLASDDSAFMTGSVLLIDGGSAIVNVSGTPLSSAVVNWGCA
ncbi:MAG: SDR family oxidoreductase [Deltaproteobacteria bacterium]|nr:SDR family oxidoreductase [Deltaproteobacteria bacterium]